MPLPNDMAVLLQPTLGMCAFGGGSVYLVYTVLIACRLMTPYTYSRPCQFTCSAYCSISRSVKLSFMNFVMHSYMSP